MNGRRPWTFRTKKNPADRLEAIAMLRTARAMASLQTSTMRWLGINDLRIFVRPKDPVGFNVRIDYMMPGALDKVSISGTIKV